LANNNGGMGANALQAFGYSGFTGNVQGTNVMRVENQSFNYSSPAIEAFAHSSGTAAVRAVNYDSNSPQANTIPGIGVYGEGSVGVVGWSNLIDGFGVIGHVSGGSNSTAVRAENQGSGAGLSAQSSSGIGVYARGVTGVAGQTFDPNGTGVYANAQGSGNALVAEGNSRFNYPGSGQWTSFYGNVDFSGASVYGLGAAGGVPNPLFLSGTSGGPIISALNTSGGPALEGDGDSIGVRGSVNSSTSFMTEGFDSQAYLYTNGGNAYAYRGYVYTGGSGAQANGLDLQVTANNATAQGINANVQSYGGGNANGLNVSVSSAGPGSYAANFNNNNAGDAVHVYAYGGAGIRSTANNGEGVYGESYNGNAGVHGYSSSGFGYGVWGQATANNGVGLYGTASDSSGFGVQAINFSGGTAIRASSYNAPAGTQSLFDDMYTYDGNATIYGGDFQVSNYGSSGFGTTYGVRGWANNNSSSSTAIGLYGYSNGPGANYGVKGEINTGGFNNAGVFGNNNFGGVNGMGVLGIGGQGVVGSTTSGYGLPGVHTGVFGFANAPSDVAVYGSNGSNIGVQGNGSTGVFGSGNFTGVYGSANFYGVNGVISSQGSDGRAGVAAANTVSSGSSPATALDIDGGITMKTSRTDPSAGVTSGGLSMSSAIGGSGVFFGSSSGSVSSPTILPSSLVHLTLVDNGLPPNANVSVRLTNVSSGFFSYLVTGYNNSNSSGSFKIHWLVINTR
jgi:hypothetical protein